MRLTIFGATGSVGRECVAQGIAAGHEITVLVRTPAKLSPELRAQVTVLSGDALEAEDVARALGGGSEAVLFAIGIDRASPEDLCTTVTRNIVAAIPGSSVRRLVWCGGGSTLVEEDRVTAGAKFVELFARTFMGLRHRDKAHQLAFLQAHREVEWVGLRPLQIRTGPTRGCYRVGFDAFNGMSRISFGDVAHAMLEMLEDDAWLHKAPIIQY